MKKDALACVFCASPEVHAREIFRTELVRAFPTNMPVVPGHVLVVPTRHVRVLAELTEAERAALFGGIERVKAALSRLFGATDFNHAWNEGEVAGQSVPHLHVHVLPRRGGDTGVTEYEPRRFLYRPGSREATPEAELAAVAASIRAMLGA